MQTLENNFRYDSVMNKPTKALLWLVYESRIKDHFYMCTALLNGGEKCLMMNGCRYYVDGYSPDDQTVYSFCGDMWHACPIHTDQNAMHPIHKDRTNA